MRLKEILYTCAEIKQCLERRSAKLVGGRLLFQTQASKKVKAMAVSCTSVKLKSFVDTD